MTFLAFAGTAAASILSVPQGGTGVNTMTGLIQGNGTAPFTPVSVGTGLDLTTGILSATGVASSVPEGTPMTGSTGTGVVYSNASNNLTTNNLFTYDDSGDSLNVGFPASGDSYININEGGAQYQFGDINGYSSGSKIGIFGQRLEYDTNGYPYLSVDQTDTEYDLGDIGSSGNGTQLDMNDGNSTINFKTNIASLGAAASVFSLNGATDDYQLGDLGCVNGCTVFDVNDAASVVTATADRGFAVKDTPGNDFLDIAPLGDSHTTAPNPYYAIGDIDGTGGALRETGVFSIQGLFSPGPMAEKGWAAAITDPVSTNPYFGVTQQTILSGHGGHINQYGLGDINGNSGLALKIVDECCNAPLVKQETADLGDVNDTLNGTDIKVDDGSQSIANTVAGIFTVQDTSSDEGLLANFTAGNPVVQIGDVDGIFNSTSFTVNDATQQVIDSSVVTDIDNPLTGAMSAEIGTNTGGIYDEFGDLDGTGNNTVFSIDDSSGSMRATVLNDVLIQGAAGGHWADISPGTGDIDLGDISGVSGSTTIDLNDAAGTVKVAAEQGFSVTDTGSTQYLNVDPFAGTITFFNAYGFPGADGSTGQVLTTNGAGLISWATPSSGSGTVTSVSVVSANGFAGTVATSTTTPAITLTTSVTGLIKGNGTAISAATAGTDYLAAVNKNSTLTGAGTTASALGINLSNANGWAALQSFGNNISIAGASFNVTSLTPGDILRYNGTNWVNTPGASLAPVTSVSNSDGTLTISPTAGSVVASLALAHANTWTGKQTFNTTAPSFGTLTTNGGIFYGSGTGLLQQTGAGTTTTLLHGGTSPSYSAVALAADVSGTLPITNGGTGQITANAAFNALAPSQTGNSGKFLTTNGTNTSWGTPSASTTIGNPVSGGTANDILFVDGSGNLGENNNFFYDPSGLEIRIGFGTGNYFDLNQTLDQYNFGDYGNITNGDALKILDNSNTIKLTANVNGNLGAPVFSINATSAQYQWGDIADHLNGTNILMDDVHGHTTVTSGGNFIVQQGAGDQSLDLSYDNDNYAIGDISGFINGTYLNINDSTQVTSVNKSFSIDTTSPVSSFEVAGSVGHKVNTISASATLTSSQEYILCDATSGAVVLTLPSAASAYNSTSGVGRQYTVKKIDSSVNTCTITRAGSDTIDGSITDVITTPYSAAVVFSAGGTAWYVQ